MPSVSGTVVIQRPPASVFAAIEDPKVQMTFDPMFRGVEQLTPGPIARGTRFRGDFKGMGKVEYEYADFEPGRRIVHAVRMPFGGMRHAFELAPEGATATQLAQSMDAELNLLG